MSDAIGYTVYDPATNSVGTLQNFDADYLAAGERDGLVYTAIYDDGTSGHVSASDVREPIQPEPVNMVFAMPSYVNDRLIAITDILGAMAGVLGVGRSAGTKVNNVIGVAIDSADDSRVVTIDQDGIDRLDAEFSKLEGLIETGDPNKLD